LEFLFQIIGSTIAYGVAIIEELRVDLKINTWLYLVWILQAKKYLGKLQQELLLLTWLAAT